MVIAIFGPTGVGKTSIAVELADLLRQQGEDPVAISADALQLYAGLETLTGAAGRRERERLEHRLVGCVPASRRFSVGEFAPLAHAEIDAALANGRRPIVVGGTGLYLRAALADLNLRPPPPAGVREGLTRRAETEGPEALHRELQERAPDAASSVDPRDRSRVIRALELLEIDESPDPEGSEGPGLWTADTRHPTRAFGLVMERDALYARIDRRVGEITAGGGAEEARVAEGAGASATARKALGFEELLAGDVDGMRRRTRNYAKRQLTWMRKLPGVETVDVTGRDPRDVAGEIAAALE